jgi:hypothetical protein
MKGTLRGDRLEDSPMRNSAAGYKPTVAFRKTYGKIFFENSPGNIGFSASGLLSVLKETDQRGITVHSVISVSSGGYVDFVQK